MLQLNKSYYESGHKRRKITPVQRLDRDRGTIVRVYLAFVQEESDTAYPRALREARDRPETAAGDRMPIESEVWILQQLYNIYGEDTVPVPRHAEAVQLQGIVQPVLLMEVINAPELYDYYKLLKQNNPLGAEIQIWRIALQYVDLIRTQLFQIGVIVMDRKQDTFRYDDEANRLIVMDWNSYEHLRGAPAGSHVNKHLQQLVHIWYTLFTAQSSHQKPSLFLSHDRWQEMTLFSRRFICSHFGSSFKGMLQGALDIFEAELQELIAQLESAGEELWLKYKTSDLAYAEDVPEEDILDLLSWADLAQRQQMPWAQEATKRYETIYAKHFQLGAGEHARDRLSKARSFTPPSEITPATFRTQSDELYRQIEKFIDNYYENLAQHGAIPDIEALLNRFNQIVGQPPRTYSKEIAVYAEQVKHIRDTIQNAGIHESDALAMFQQFLDIHDCYFLYAEIQSELASGLSSNPEVVITCIETLLVNMERLEHSSTGKILDALALDVESLVNARHYLKQQTQETRTATVLGSLRANFVAAVQGRRVAEFVSRLEMVLHTSNQDMRAQQILHKQMEISQRLVVLANYEPPKVDEAIVYLQEVTDIIRPYPELYMWAVDTHLVQAGRRHYTNLSATIKVHPIQEFEFLWLKLNQCLIDLYGLIQVTED